MRTPGHGLGVVALGLAVSLAAAACGDRDAGRANGAPTGQWRDCTVAAFDDAGAPVATLPTDGVGVSVKLPDGGPCAEGLVARLPSGVVGLDVSGLRLDPSTAVKVTLSGGGQGPPQLLRIDGGAHPRGGFQPHLFVVDGQVREVTVNDNPLVPFVATDGGAAPMTVRCGPDGTVQVLRATTSEPPGVVLAWDVERTSYQIGPGRTVSSVTEQVRDHAADPVLQRDMPELFEPGSLFTNC